MTDLRTRLGAVTFVVAALVVLAGAPASAVGAGGVEMTVQLPRTADDRLRLEVGTEPTTTTIVLTNVTADPKRVDVYAVEAEVDGANVVLGSPDSAPWLGLARTSVELGAEEVRTVEFTTDPAAVPPADGGGEHVAVVLELTQGASVVVRAASVVHVRQDGALPIGVTLLIAVATVLVVLASQALLLEMRKRTRAAREEQQREEASIDWRL